MEDRFPVERAKRCLGRLCNDIGARPVGSRANLDATMFLSQFFSRNGFDTEERWFECFDWTSEGADFHIDDEQYTVQSGPYSLAASLKAPLVSASSIGELRRLREPGAIVLLHGDICREPLLPRNFPFFRVDEHIQLIEALEDGGFGAVLAATAPSVKAPQGFPLIVDGDFHIPNGFLPETDGERVLERADGRLACLDIRARRAPSRGCNVVARKGPPSGPRVVIMAHVDSAHGSPGAADNASGVCTMMLLAESLDPMIEGLRIELVAMNGEDHYASPGEVLYLADNRDLLGDVALGINIDGIGVGEGVDEFSLYSCPDLFADAARSSLEAEGLVEGRSWMEGDHTLFVQSSVPALALTSSDRAAVAEASHSIRDVASVVDTGRLVAGARGLRALLDLIPRLVRESSL